jgi:hypothetical protein
MPGSVAMSGHAVDRQSAHRWRAIGRGAVFGGLDYDIGVPSGTLTTRPVKVFVKSPPLAVGADRTTARNRDVNASAPLCR